MTNESSVLSVVDLPTRSVLGYRSLEQAFPDVPPGVRPFGNRVLVQIRTPMTRTASGLFVPEQSRETEQWNTQVAKVIALGPLAFHNQTTNELYPEGAWCKVGDFVRCPKYGGDRWNVPVPGSADPALFVLFTDLDLLGMIEGDPLAQVAFLQ